MNANGFSLSYVQIGICRCVPRASTPFRYMKRRFVSEHNFCAKLPANALNHLIVACNLKTLVEERDTPGSQGNNNTPVSPRQRPRRTGTDEKHETMVVTSYRMVICLIISPPLLPRPPSRTAEDVPGFFSKSFQNLRLSSAATFLVSRKFHQTLIQECY